MRFALPNDIKVADSHDVDYWLQAMVDLTTTAMSSPQIFVTWVLSDSAQELGGLDLRGKRPGGTLWRWLGPPNGTSVGYEGATEAVSTVFDGIIDSMCIATH